MIISKQKIAFSGFIITFVGAVLFSTKAIIVKKAFANTSVDALTLLTLRMVFSLPFYLIAAYLISSRQANVKMTKKQWLYTFLLGLCGYYLSSFLDFLGLQYISAGLERLILFLYPTFAVLLNSAVFKQKIYRTQKIALLLTYAGIIIAFLGELQIIQHDENFILGCLLVLLCALTFSIYLTGSGRIIPQVGSAKFTAYAMLSATLGIFIHFILNRNIETLNSGNDLWLYGILLAVVATVIPSFLISNGMKKIGSNNVAIISSIGPVSTIIQAHYFLGEQIFAAQIAGTILVIIGIILLGWRSSIA